MNSKLLDNKIVLFIKQQTIVTLATSVNNIPFCATCFYSYMEKYNFLIFKSGRETQHIREALQNKFIAGTILPDKSEIGKIKGIQFNGIFIEPVNDLLDEAKKAYYKKYPFATAFKGELWIVELTFIKFTDNTLGFGKKIKWEKDTIS